MPIPAHELVYWAQPKPSRMDGKKCGVEMSGAQGKKAKTPRNANEISQRMTGRKEAQNAQKRTPIGNRKRSDKVPTCQGSFSSVRFRATLAAISRAKNCFRRRLAGGVFKALPIGECPLAFLSSPASRQSIRPSWRWALSLSISGVQAGSKTIATFTFFTPGRCASATFVPS